MFSWSEISQEKETAKKKSKKTKNKAEWENLLSFNLSKRNGEKDCTDKSQDKVKSEIAKGKVRTKSKEKKKILHYKSHTFEIMNIKKAAINNDWGNFRACFSLEEEELSAFLFKL